jgi:hypothetical protein
MGDGDGGDVSCCNEPQVAFIFLYLIYLTCVLLLGDTVIARPMRLLATAVHEISHALACWLTCGRVLKLEVYENAGGVTHYQGGMRCLIAPAGYLGEAFWGMVFVVLSGGRRTATAAAVGLVLALTGSLCYSPNRVLVILTVGYVVVTLAFVFIEWFWFSPILAYVILLFGVFLGTYAVIDIFSHLILRSRPGSDSYDLYEQSGKCCPPRCIATVWLFVAVILQLFAVWLALILMSEECEDEGWFECVFDSKLDLDLEEFDWWPDEWGWDWK